MNSWESLISEQMTALTRAIRLAYGATQPIPHNVPSLDDIPVQGKGAESLSALWDLIVAGSSKLGAPNMVGHMDTAPHPYAALTEAVVASVNNNLLFRELSPIASKIEEALIELFKSKVGFKSGGGIFASGGSLANLTALFAACGGFGAAMAREKIFIHAAPSTHISVKKSAAILGIPKSQICMVSGDSTGRMDPEALARSLSAASKARNIVVAVAGSTVHGAIDPLADIAAVAKRYEAWLHVDAIYGGAVLFSDCHKQLLAGIGEADSIVLAPQKWMFVPRLSAVVLLRDSKLFDESLGVDIPYSATGEPHRGKWGIQGSRRADAVTLWVLLQSLGTSNIARAVEHGIEISRTFNRLLESHSAFEPTHSPELNLQCFRFSDPESNSRIGEIHKALTAAGGPWVSLSQWNGEKLFRSVLLSPDCDQAILERLLSDLVELSQP